MASRVGTSAHASLIAAQLLRVREGTPDIWARTGRVQVASAFLASLVAGTWIGMNEAEACSTGMWVFATGGQGHWDDEVLELVGGSKEEGRKVRGWLGDVDVSGGSRKASYISKYMVERYGFEAGVSIFGFSITLLAVNADPFRFRRHHHFIIYSGLSFDLSFSVSFTIGRCPLTWTNGLHDYQRTTLPTDTSV